MIVCTLNRSVQLRRCLQALADQITDDGIHEVVVVDNGSRDDTRDVVAVFEESRRDFRYVREETLGLSHARNRGILESRGEMVAFLDDDAEPEPGWIDALADLCRSRPNVSAVAGRILPVWPDGRPRWLPDPLLEFLTVLDLGDESVDLTAHSRNPYGANMAVRREYFDRVGLFDPRLGRVGGSLISMEERDLFHRLRGAGGTILYDPRVAVRHHVEPERLSAVWLARRSYAQGRSRARFVTRWRRRSRLGWFAVAGWYVVLTARDAMLTFLAVVPRGAPWGRRGEFVRRATAVMQKAGYARGVLVRGALRRAGPGDGDAGYSS